VPAWRVDDGTIISRPFDKTRDDLLENFSLAKVVKFRHLALT